MIWSHQVQRAALEERCGVHVGMSSFNELSSLLPVDALHARAVSTGYAPGRCDSESPVVKSYFRYACSAQNEGRTTGHPGRCTTRTRHEFFGAAKNQKPGNARTFPSVPPTPPEPHPGASPPRSPTHTQPTPKRRRSTPQNLAEETGRLRR